MVKCNTGDCPKGKGNICCFECEQLNTCEVACNEKPVGCDNAIHEGETQMEVFQNKAAMVIREIAGISAQKKALEARDKTMREQLEKVMEEFGVKSFENELIKLTYTEPTTRESIDSAKLKKELPEVAAKYTKVTNVKGSVRITVK